jgi:hypothetical protein
MIQSFTPERIFQNSIEQCLIPIDPNGPNEPCDDCENQVVANIQDYLSILTADVITDTNLKIEIQNRGTLQEFATKLITDLNISFT